MSVELGIPGVVDATPVGRGGFATVYRARQPAFDRTVAVKVITAVTDDVHALDRFERERKAMGALSDHPGIVTVHDAGVTPGGDPYLVMAFLAGGSLRQHLDESGAVGWEESARIGLQVAGALDAAHRIAIVHRDVKPANLLRSNYGGVQLTDFGIARIAGGPETRTQQVTATLRYAPPEVLRGKPPTASGDLYSLAATVYELAGGVPAFAAGPDEAPGSLIGRILSEPVPDPTPHGVPPDLARLLVRTMAKDPAERPASAVAFVDDLASVVADHDVAVTDERPAPAADEDPHATVAEGWQAATSVAAPAPFQPSHLVPARGLQAWLQPDPRLPAAAWLDPALPVQLLRWWGDWAEIRCSNDWVAWVNGRELVPGYR